MLRNGATREQLEGKLRDLNLYCEAQSGNRPVVQTSSRTAWISTPRRRGDVPAEPGRPVSPRRQLRVAGRSPLARRVKGRVEFKDL